GAETVAAAAMRRGAVLGEADPVARPVDLGTVVEVLRGKVEFESGEEGREFEVLDHLLRRATADAARTRLAGVDLGPLVAAVEQGRPVVTGDRITAKALLDELPDLPALDVVAERLGADDIGTRAAAVELALEGLYLARRIAKHADDDGAAVYS
ncbi:magnesium chelatase, partial [Rhodococcus rhodochrous]